MYSDLPNSIEDWFIHCGDEIDFVRRGPADAYAVCAPSRNDATLVYVYATKPSCVLAPKRKYPEFDAIGLISRIGLPNIEDVSWMRDMLGQNKLMFIGDMDPGDLMIFAWLRAHLGHAQVIHLGISDSYLNHLGVELPQSYIMSCSASEQKSLPLLGTVLPDFRDIVGPDCAALLEDGRKIELEAVASALGLPGPLLSPALTRLR